MYSVHTKARRIEQLVNCLIAKVVRVHPPTFSQVEQEALNFLILFLNHFWVIVGFVGSSFDQLFELQEADRVLVLLFRLIKILFHVYLLVFHPTKVVSNVPTQFYHLNLFLAF